MKKRIIALLMSVVLAVILANFSALVNVKADAKKEALERLGQRTADSFNEYRRTHYRDKNGNKVVISDKKEQKNNKKYKKKKSIPSKYVGPYTSVKSQGNLSTCWMFASLSTVESNLLLRANYASGKVAEDPVDFSEAQGIYTQYNRNTVDGTVYGNKVTDSDNDMEKSADRYLGYEDGGWLFDATMALASNKATAFESENPYYGNRSGISTMASVAAGQYKLNRFDLDSANKIPDIYYVYEENGKKKRGFSEEAADVWKQAIVDNGAIVSNYNYTSSDKYYQGWGIDKTQYETLPNYWFFDATNRRVWSTNHQITIVGYDDNYSRFKFMVKKGSNDYDEIAGEIVYIKETNGQPNVVFDEDGHLVSADISSEPQEGYEAYIVPKRDGTWLIKNSHGAEYDGEKIYEDGITYISYEEETLAETATIIPKENLNQILNNEKVYDATLTHSSIKPEEDIEFEGDEKAAEVFTVPEDKDFELKEVGYWTCRDETVTSIKIYSDLADSQNPESGTLVYNKEGLTDSFEGYHSHKLDSSIKFDHGTKLSVFVESVDADGNRCVNIEVDRMGSVASYLFNYDKNDMFIYEEGEWMNAQELDEFYKEEFGFTTGNMTMKLFGSETDAPCTVTVDGNETTVKKGDSFTFPTPSENGYATSGYETLYASGQTIEVNSDITVTSIPELSISMDAGASIKLDGKDGIRFCAKALCGDEDIFESDNVTEGTLLTAYDIFTEDLDYEMSLDDYEAGKEGIMLVMNKGWMQGDVGHFAAGLMNVSEANWTREFIARSFVKLNYSNNTSKVIYAGYSDSRSIVDVAERIRDAGYPGLTDDQIDIVNKYLS